MIAALMYPGGEVLYPQCGEVLYMVSKRPSAFTSDDPSRPWPFMVHINYLRGVPRQWLTWTLGAEYDAAGTQEEKEGKWTMCSVPVGEQGHSYLTVGFQNAEDRTMFLLYFVK